MFVNETIKKKLKKFFQFFHFPNAISCIHSKLKLQSIIFKVEIKAFLKNFPNKKKKNLNMFIF